MGISSIHARQYPHHRRGFALSMVIIFLLSALTIRALMSATRGDLHLLAAVAHLKPPSTDRTDRR
jgi:hypothetical protein